MPIMNRSSHNKKNAVEALAFDPKVESEILAKLTSSLAHDCNNQLARILALGEELQFQLNDGASGTTPENFRLFSDTILTTKQTVQRIGEVSRKSGPKAHHDLNLLLKDAAELVRKILPKSVTIQINTAQEPLPVYADGAAFRWMIIELVWLAVEGKGSRSGKLSFMTTRDNRPTQPGISLKLTIDDGLKLPSHVFGSGTINLSSFLQKHRGDLEVDKQNACIQVWLPEADFSETASE